MPRGLRRGGVSSASNLENIAGASFALLMDEASGWLIDEISSIPLVQYNAVNTYGVEGSAGYGKGVTMNPVAGGFSNYGVWTSLEFLDGDGNIFLDLRCDGALGAFSEVFSTSIPEATHTGFSIRGYKGASIIGSAIYCLLVASDGTTVTANWSGNEAGAAVYSGGEHTWEFRISRSARTVELLVDGISQGTVDITLLCYPSMKSLGSTGIGVGCDYRPGINRNVPVTIWFIRVIGGQIGGGD